MHENNSYPLPFDILAFSIAGARSAIAAAWLRQSKIENQKSKMPMKLSGDHTHVATPVPIPNTAVKHVGPMIV